MSEIVIVEGGTALTTTIAIAEGTDNEHASVISLVRKYIDDLLYCGQVDFKSTRTYRGGHPVEHAYTKIKFTPKRIQWVAGLWAAELIEGGA